MGAFGHKVTAKIYLIVLEIELLAINVGWKKAIFTIGSLCNVRISSVSLLLAYLFSRIFTLITLEKTPPKFTV